MTPEEKLTVIETILFPAATTNDDGSKTLHDVDENLDSALYDLRRTKADPVCITTVENVVDRLTEVRKLLGVPDWHQK